MAFRRARAALSLLLASVLGACSAGADDPDSSLEVSSAAAAETAGVAEGSEAASGLVTDASVAPETGSEGDDAEETPVAGPARGEGATAAGAAEPEPDWVEAVAALEAAGERPRFVRPDSIKGLYVNAWAAGSTRRMNALLELARETEVNTFVLDIKDVTGHISHRSKVPLAQESGALNELRIRDLSGVLRRLESEGIYPIARIVIVKDSVLAHARPELAIQDTAGGLWYDSKGVTWLNLHQRGVWEHHVDLAEEVARMGFPEVQWDYVRFPDSRPSDMARAHFPGGESEARTDAVRGFLEYAGERLDALDLDVHMTADIFGVATSFPRVAGIGQEWEKILDRVDAAHPMIYPSHYGAGSHGFDQPNAYPYEIVLAALEYARRRNEAMEVAGDVRPWLQDFTMGSPRYEAPEVRAQIQATYDAGYSGWILWNPSTRYSEDALRPAEGFADEPLVRVAGEIVPVSERRAAIERVAAREQAVADSIRRATEEAERAAAEAAANEARGVVLPPDTISGSR